MRRGSRIVGIALAGAAAAASRLPPVRSHPRAYAVLVAIILVTPILLTGGGIIGLGAPPPPVPVSFSTSHLNGGEVNSIRITFRDTAASIELPRGFLPIIREMVTTRAAVSDSDLTEGVLELVVPPVNGTFTFGIVSPKGHWTHAFEVDRGLTPVVSGEDAVGNLELLTQAYQFRFSGSPKLLRAAEHFRDLFTGFGLDARMYFYPWEISSRPVIGKTFINIIVVCGFQQGTVDAGEWIVLGGHMDSVPQAVEGAYDDGSGTSSLLEVAQGLSQFKTRHTIVYCLWGGEEEGLYGSNRWVANEIEGKVRLYVNMDMAGLSWPAPFNFTAFVGPDTDDATLEHPGLVSLVENVTEHELRYPREGNFSILEDPFGRSDHVSFWSTGAPTVFFFGADDITYPEYHSRDDTLATMTGHAGGREMLVAGFDTLVWECFYLAVHADQDEID